MKRRGIRVSMRPGAPLWIALLTATAIAAVVVPPIFPHFTARHELFLRPALVGIALLCAAMLVRSIVMPIRTVARGLRLVRAQGFTDRLLHVNEATSDRIVDLFNSIIDRLRAERVRNSEQEAFLTQLLDAAPMGVLVLDFDGRAAMFNPAFAELAGIPAQTGIIGLTPSELPSEMAAQIAAVPKGESHTLRQGDRHMYRCTHRTFRRYGFLQSFYILERLTEEVRRAEHRAYETVIRTLAHEVNNTMGGVRSALEMMTDALPDPDLRDVAASCAERCVGLSCFINAYADVVRVPEPQLAPTDLCALLDALVPFLCRIGGELVKIRIEKPDEAVVAPVDQALMQQVVVNVVKNAIESMPPEGGEIVMSVGRTATHHPRIEIANNGAPIPPEVANNIFRPFFTTKRDGRGLGLTLTGEILERHHALYSLRTGPDALTRFTIDLPA